jgi:hypothetical protein
VFLPPSKKSEPSPGAQMKRSRPTERPVAVERVEMLGTADDHVVAKAPVYDIGTEPADQQVFPEGAFEHVAKLQGLVAAAAGQRWVLRLDERVEGRVVVGADLHFEIRKGNGSYQRCHHSGARGALDGRGDQLGNQAGPIIRLWHRNVPPCLYEALMPGFLISPSRLPRIVPRTAVAGESGHDRRVA